MSELSFLAITTHERHSVIRERFGRDVPICTAEACWSSVDNMTTPDTNDSPYAPFELCTAKESLPQKGKHAKGKRTKIDSVRLLRGSSQTAM